MSSMTHEEEQAIVEKIRAIQSRGDHVVLVGIPASIPEEKVKAAVNRLADAFRRTQEVLIYPLAPDEDPAVVGASLQATLLQLRGGK